MLSQDEDHGARHDIEKGGCDERQLRVRIVVSVTIEIVDVETCITISKV